MAKNQIIVSEEMTPEQIEAIEAQLAQIKVDRRAGEIEKIEAQIVKIDAQIDALKSEKSGLKAQIREMRGQSGKGEGGKRQHGREIGENGQQARPALIAAVLECAREKRTFTIMDLRPLQLKHGWESFAKDGSWTGWCNRLVNNMIEKGAVEEIATPGKKKTYKATGVGKVKAIGVEDIKVPPHKKETASDG